MPGRRSDWKLQKICLEYTYNTVCALGAFNVNAATAATGIIDAGEHGEGALAGKGRIWESIPGLRLV